MTAVEVCERYYQVIDRKRDQMGRLYETDAVLIWNGIKKSNQVRICVVERAIVTSSII